MRAHLFAGVALASSACSGTQEPGGFGTPAPAVVAVLETELPRSAEMLRCGDDPGNRLAGIACVRVVLDNAMPGSFVLREARVGVDGTPLRAMPEIADVADPASQVRQVEIFTGPMKSGRHVINVWLRHRGHGLGVFSYLAKYTFTVSSRHGFALAPGESLDLRVVAYDKGGATTPLDERPAVLYQERRRPPR